MTGAFANRPGLALGTGATVFHEVADEGVHRRIVGAIDERAVLTLLQDQASVPQLRKMKRQRTVRNAKCLGDGPGREPTLARLNEKPEKRQAMLLSQSAQCLDC